MPVLLINVFLMTWKRKPLNTVYWIIDLKKTENICLIEKGYMILIITVVFINIVFNINAFMNLIIYSNT